MDDHTKRAIDMVIKFAEVRNLKCSFVISKRDDTLVGFDIRFDEPIDLNMLPSIKHCMEILGK